MAAGEAEANRLGIGARRQAKLVFEILLPRPPAQIYAGIHLAVSDGRIVPGFARRFGHSAAVIPRDPRQTSFARRFGAPPGPQEPHPDHRAGAPGTPGERICRRSVSIESYRIDRKS